MSPIGFVAAASKSLIPNVMRIMLTGTHDTHAQKVAGAHSNDEIYIYAYT